MENSLLFTTFVSQIFGELYESFPIAKALPEKEIIESVESRDEFWRVSRELSSVIDLVEILEVSGQLTPEMRVRASEKQQAATSRLEEFEQRRCRVVDVYQGTVVFLVEEGFIRTMNQGRYQLTLKGFTHLNRSFSQGSIGAGPTLIDKLLDALRPEHFSGAVTAGTLSNLISKVLGP